MVTKNLKGLGDIITDVLEKGILDNMSIKTTNIEDLIVIEVRGSTETDQVAMKQDNDIIRLSMDQVRTLAPVLNEIY